MKPTAGLHWWHFIKIYYRIKCWKWPLDKKGHSVAGPIIKASDTNSHQSGHFYLFSIGVSNSFFQGVDEKLGLFWTTPISWTQFCSVWILSLFKFLLLRVDVKPASWKGQCFYNSLIKISPKQLWTKCVWFCKNSFNFIQTTIVIVFVI